MSRLVRIGKHMVELSGLHGIWKGADHLCQSQITLFYPNNSSNNNNIVITYEYGKWADCSRDVKILEEAKKEYNKK
jgi:hypothetical protein